MSKPVKKSKKQGVVAKDTKTIATQTDFEEVVGLITAARTRAVTAVNSTIIDLYWSIGQYINNKTIRDGWGKGTVENLAGYIQRRQPNPRGYSASNLWRMMQFFETYRDRPILAPLVRELPWTHNLLSRTMSPALVAEYQTRMPDKKMLQAKLHEFYELDQEQAELPVIEDKQPAMSQSAKPRKGRKK